MCPLYQLSLREKISYIKKELVWIALAKKPNLWIHCSCFMTEHKYFYIKDSCSGKSRIYNNCRLCEGIRLGWSWRYKTQSRAEASLYSDDDTPPFVPSMCVFCPTNIPQNFRFWNNSRLYVRSHSSTRFQVFYSKVWY